jgi:putative FmdB family regulatory protein
MPTYEYVCDACGHEFELLQRMSDPAVRKCPECAKLKVRRIISGGAGVIFKGSGFYETDYKRARQGPGGTDRKREDGSEPSSAKPEPASEPKKDAGGTASDAKPDRKPDAGKEQKPPASDGGKPETKPSARSDSPNKKGR